MRKAEALCHLGDKKGGALQKKLEGNIFFKSKQYLEAIASYSMSLDWDSSNETLYANR